MKIIDIYSDEFLIIITEEKKFIFCKEDFISITMNDGIIIKGKIDEIYPDSIVIDNNTLIKYKFEKMRLLNK